MSRSLVLPAAFAVVVAAGAWHTLQALPAPPAPLQVQVGQVQVMSRGAPPAEPGVWPEEWIHGADCDGDPRIEVHAYNEDTYVLRQSKCDTYEAPFMYLLFGEDKALLMDTGAFPQSPVFLTVNGVIRDWLTAKGRTEIPLVVAHTHHHFDHVASDAQFSNVPYVEQLVPTNLFGMTQFFGFEDYPNDVPSIDLGGRVIDVLATPGHHPQSVSLYDRNTQVLFTGDIVYPGHLFVFSANDWPVFVASIQRLVDWAMTHPVKWVVGCHIETADTPFSPYAYTTLVQPDEHPVQFTPTILPKILHAALSQGGDPQCEIFDWFVIHPVYKCGIVWNG